MATTEILLLKHVKELGSEGDLVKVKAGYARNFLFPRNIALPANRTNKNQIQALQNAKLAREQRECGEAKALADKLSAISLAIVVKTGENGKMFGAVTAKEIAEHLEKNGIIVDKKKIHTEHPIKEIGRHKVSIKLHASSACDLLLDVVSENPIS